MAKPKSITIKLTSTQRTQLRSLTGEDHKEVYFEAVSTRGKQAAPAVARRMAARSVGKGIRVIKAKIPAVGSPGGGGGGGGPFDPSL